LPERIAQQQVNKRVGMDRKSIPLHSSIFKKPYFVWVCDFSTLFLALYMAYWLRINYRNLANPIAVPLERTLVSLAASGVYTIIFSIEGLYRRSKLIGAVDQLLSIAKAVTLGFLIFLGLSFVLKSFPFIVETRGIVALGWLLCVGLTSLVRIAIIRPRLRGKIRKDYGVRRAAIVGAIARAENLIGERHPLCNSYELVGFIETRDNEISSYLDPEYVLGKISSLDEIIGDYEIDELLLPLSLVENRQSFEIVSKCTRTGLPVRLISDMFEVLAPDASAEHVDALPPSGFGEPALKGLGLVAKRAMDLAIAISVVVIFAPLFLLIALLIKMFSPGPVLFKQIRAGKDGKPFTFYKFRTMRHDTDDTLHREYAANFIGGKELRLKDEISERKIYKMPNDPRVTPIGRILRRTSLDELPQIFNVIKGEMSLVGPRPPIAYELSIYKDWHKRRLKAKPGITGLWQVSGRSSVPFHDMVLLDLYYINRWSLRMDIEILLRTIPVVLLGKGAY